MVVVERQPDGSYWIENLSERQAHMLQRAIQASPLEDVQEIRRAIVAGLIIDSDIDELAEAA
jgi:hypothetical protein